MKVRAKRKHLNAYGDVVTKHPGKHYELPDDAAGPLIDTGIVEQIDDEDDAPTPATAPPPSGPADGATGQG